jgi:hypothetical protein
MKQKALYYAHCFLPLLGLFMCVGGTYGVVQLIINAYADSEIGKLAFPYNVE